MAAAKYNTRSERFLRKKEKEERKAFILREKAERKGNKRKTNWCRFCFSLFL